VYRRIDNDCFSVSTKSFVDRGLTPDTSWSVGDVSYDRSVENALANRSVFGDSPSGCFTELLSTRSVVHSNRDQFYTGPKSNKIFRMCLFCTFDGPIFFFRVRYRSVVFDTRLLVKTCK